MHVEIFELLKQIAPEISELGNPKHFLPHVKKALQDYIVKVRTLKQIDALPSDVNEYGNAKERLSKYYNLQNAREHHGFRKESIDPKQFFIFYETVTKSIQLIPPFILNEIVRTEGINLHDDYIKYLRQDPYIPLSEVTNPPKGTDPGLDQLNSGTTQAINITPMHTLPKISDPEFPLSVESLRKAREILLFLPEDHVQTEYEFFNHKTMKVEPIDKEKQELILAFLKRYQEGYYDSSTTQLPHLKIGTLLWNEDQCLRKGLGAMWLSDAERPKEAQPGFNIYEILPNLPPPKRDSNGIPVPIEIIDHV